MRPELTSLALRAAIREKYAFPGGYEIFGITLDGGILCCDCMRGEYRQIAYARKHGLSDGWQVCALTLDCETDSFTACDHCGRVIVDDDNEGDN